MNLIERLPDIEFKNIDPEGPLISAGGIPLDILGITELPIEIEGKTLYSNFHVLQNLAPGILLGMDFINQYFAKLDFEKGKISLQVGKSSIETKFLDGTFHRNKSYLVTKTPMRTVEGNDERKVTFDLPREVILSPNSRSNIPCKSGRIEGRSEMTEQAEVFTLSTAMSIRVKIEQSANIADEVGHEDKETLILLLCKYKDTLDVISPVMGGNARVTPIKLDMVDDIPVKSTPYRLSIKERYIMKELVQEYMDKGLVRENVARVYNKGKEKQEKYYNQKRNQKRKK